jgi:outer membrane lipoprotein-sorting protein
VLTSENYDQLQIADFVGRYRNGMPVQAKIVERNNDTTTVLLSNIQKNVTIKGNVFDLSPMLKGVKVIDG